MAHVTPGFVPAPGDELTVRMLPVFFGVLELLLRAGVTTVADAAFQDKTWRPRLAPLRRLARIRIVQCVVDADVAMDRILRRSSADPLRRVHADPGGNQRAAQARAHATFDRVTVDAPSIEVDTTDGYRPGLAEVTAFVNRPG
jgi:predicted kinase